MNLSCPHCGSQSFKIMGDVAESRVVACINRGKTTPFEEQQAANDPPAESDRKTIQHFSSSMNGVDQCLERAEGLLQTSRELLRRHDRRN